MFPSQYLANDKVHWNGWEHNTLWPDGRECGSGYSDQQVQCQIWRYRSACVCTEAKWIRQPGIGEVQDFSSHLPINIIPSRMMTNKHAKFIFDWISNLFGGQEVENRDRAKEKDIIIKRI